MASTNLYGTHREHEWTQEEIDELPIGTYLNEDEMDPAWRAKLAAEGRMPGQNKDSDRGRATDFDSDEVGDGDEVYFLEGALPDEASVDDDEPIWRIVNVDVPDLFDIEAYEQAWLNKKEPEPEIAEGDLEYEEPETEEEETDDLSFDDNPDWV